MERLKISIESINEILISYWDPIEVSDIPECKNEYIDYAVHIWKRLQLDPNFNVFSYLRNVESETMGLQNMEFKHANLASSQINELLKKI
jgi:hypothetical protein